jgi:hypothetical protein
VEEKEKLGTAVDGRKGPDQCRAPHARRQANFGDNDDEGKNNMFS